MHHVTSLCKPCICDCGLADLFHGGSGYISGMDKPSRKQSSSRPNAEEVATFLFDDTLDTSLIGGLGTSSLFGEEIQSDTVVSSQFQSRFS